MPSHVNTSFLFIANNVLLCGYATFDLSVGTVDGHLDCFHSLAIRNKASVDIMYKCLCGRMSSSLWGIYLGAELLGHTLC